MRKAHVVARTYLKGFAKTQGAPKGVVVYDRRFPMERQVREQNIIDVKRVAVADDFYVIQRRSGPDDVIEAGLSEIESGWGAVRAALT